MRTVISFIFGIALGIGITYAFISKDVCVACAPESKKLAFPVITYGSPQAPISVIEYSSVGCGVCGAFKKHMWPEIYKKHVEPGRVHWVLHAFPLAEADVKAAMLAHCHADPEKLMTEFYLTQQRWMFAKDPVEELKTIAKEHGMSEEDIETCMKKEALLDGMIADRMYASQKYNLNGTPAFIIGQTVIPGLIPVQQFEKIFDQAEKHVQEGKPLQTFEFDKPDASPPASSVKDGSALTLEDGDKKLSLSHY